MRMMMRMMLLTKTTVYTNQHVGNSSMKDTTTATIWSGYYAYYNSYLSNGLDPDNLYYYCWYTQEWCKVPDVAVCLYVYMLL